MSSPKPPVSERLNTVLDLEEIPKNNLVPRVPAEIVPSGNEERDFDTDFDVARSMLHSIAEKVSDLSDAAIYVAKEKQDAKSFEAAAMTAKEVRETALSFMDLHQKKADLKGAKQGGGDKYTQNNAVFVGSTGDALKLARDLNFNKAFGKVEEVLTNTTTIEMETVSINTAEDSD